MKVAMKVNALSLVSCKRIYRYKDSSGNDNSYVAFEPIRNDINQEYFLSKPQETTRSGHHFSIT